MKYIAALLLALAMVTVPALAFDVTNVIPKASLEKIETPMTQDNGAYSFQRIAVDAGQTDTYPFAPQDVYSGMLFGAGEGYPGKIGSTEYRHIGYDNGPAYSAGILANKISTDAEYTYTGRTAAGVPYTVDQFVGVDTTRQFIQQGGSIYLTTRPIGSDSEIAKPWSVDLGFSKSNLAWISSKVDEFTVDAQSYGVVGGNFLPAVPKELSPFCKNVWLYEQEDLAPTKIWADNDADIIEAYAGTASKANLKMYPESVNNDQPKTLMSAYAEKFGGYDNAEVAGNNPIITADQDDGWDVNKIVIDFGSTLSGPLKNNVENYWTAGGDGVNWNWPECPDFPNNDPANLLFGTVTWPDGATYPSPQPP